MPGPNRIAEWCASKGWTLTDAAGLCGYSLSYMSLIAGGKRPLGPSAKVRIARCLGARVSDLFPVSAAPEFSDDVAAAER